METSQSIHFSRRTKESKDCGEFTRYRIFINAQDELELKYIK